MARPDSQRVVERTAPATAAAGRPWRFAHSHPRPASRSVTHSVIVPLRHAPWTRTRTQTGAWRGDTRRSRQLGPGAAGSASGSLTGPSIRNPVREVEHHAHPGSRALGALCSSRRMILISA